MIEFKIESKPVFSAADVQLLNKIIYYYRSTILINEDDDAEIEKTDELLAKINKLEMIKNE